MKIFRIIIHIIYLTIFMSFNVNAIERRMIIEIILR
jgi:hypothetical protein